MFNVRPAGSPRAAAVANGGKLMRGKLGRKMTLHRETVRHLGLAGDGRAGIPQTWPDSTPQSACCTASCHHIC